MRALSWLLAFAAVSASPAALVVPSASADVAPLPAPHGSGASLGGAGNNGNGGAKLQPNAAPSVASTTPKGPVKTTKKLGAPVKKTTKKKVKTTKKPKPDPPPPPPPQYIPATTNKECKSGMYYFTGDTVAFDEKHFKETTEWLVTENKYGNLVELTNEGITFRLLRSRQRDEWGNFWGEGSVLTSVRRMRYGKTTARMRIGPRMSSGVVASFIYMSPRADEIDWEWTMGKNPTLATNNWFSGPMVTANNPQYGRDKLCTIPDDARWNFHEYTIEWTADHIIWYIDGRWCNQVNRADWNLGNGNYLYPEENPNIQFGIWDGGYPEGTRDWTGGRVPWDSPESDAGYESTVSWVKTECW